MALPGTNGNEGNDAKRKTYDSSKMQTALTLSLGAKMGAIGEKKRQEEIDERKRAAAYVKSDPLGLNAMTMKEESGKRESNQSPKASGESRTKVRFSQNRGKQEDNIFTDFGKAHGNGMHTVEIGGVLHQRADFKRHWRSDPDIRRWQKALTDNSRNGKLMFDVRGRWHPNLTADIADLTQNHNAHFRRRYTSQEADRHKSSADKVRELQETLFPKQGKSKKRLGGFFHEEYRKAQIFDPELVPKSAVGQIMHFLKFLQFHCPRLEDAYSFIDNNGNGSVSFSEFAEALKKLRFPGDIKFTWRLIDNDHSGLISESEWKKLEPYMLQLRVQDKLEKMSVERKLDDDDALYLQALKESKESQANDQRGKASSIERASKDSQDSEDIFVGGPSVHWALEVEKTQTKTAGEPSTPSETDQDGTSTALFLKSNKEQENQQASHDSRISPVHSRCRTLSIFVYRNAVRSHAGEAVFISKPPQNLQDLVRVIGQSCRPLIEPAAKLLDTSLIPIRGIQQVQNGGVYLLKGQEGLDPPPHFLARQEKPHGESLKHLHNMQLSSFVELGALKGGESPSRRLHRTSGHVTRGHLSATGLVGRLLAQYEQTEMADARPPPTNGHLTASFKFSATSGVLGF